MFKITSSIAVVAALATFSGCAITPTQSIVYQKTTAPVMVSSAQSAGKVGESEKCTNILGIIATGDCSIASAAKNGNIKTVSTVDWKGTNILGIISTGKTVVTGK